MTDYDRALAIAKLCAADNYRGATLLRDYFQATGQRVPKVGEDMDIATKIMLTLPKEEGTMLAHYKAKKLPWQIQSDEEPK